LPFSCSSEWSAPPAARWCNSVLNAALCPRGQLQDPPPALIWEVGLSSHPHSQPLCLSKPLLSASGCSGKLPCYPTPMLSLCSQPCSPGQVHHSTPTSTVCVRLQFAVCFSVLLGGGFSPPWDALHYFPGCGSWSHMWCMMLTFSFCNFTQAPLELAAGEK
jgi:hypothetical protein